jgi:hypothetical protein
MRLLHVSPRLVGRQQARHLAHPLPPFAVLQVNQDFQSPVQMKSEEGYLLAELV